jgi:hypothetical protein
MAKPETVIIDGRAYSWRQLCELRRRQRQAFEAARPAQAVLFELKEDRRPAAERTAAGRFTEPMLFESMAGQER